MSGVWSEMRAWGRAAASGLCLLALATGLPAQTLPVPTLPPTESAPTPGPESTGSASPESPSPPTKIAAPAAPRPWEYGLSAGVLYASNVYYVAPQGSSGTAFLPSADVARVLASPRGELRVLAGGRWAGYSKREIEDRFYFDAGVTGDYRLSAGTSVLGSFRYDIGYSDSTSILVDQGVALPLAKTQSLSGNLELTQKLGPRTSLRASGRWLRATFEDPAFLDGSSLRGSVVLDRNVGLRDIVGVAYALERGTGDPAVGPYLTHYGSLQWSHALSDRSAVLFEGGASYTGDAAAAGLQSSTGFFGGLTFARKVRRSNVTAFLRREVAPAFGLGVSRQESRAGLNMDVPMGRRWNLRVGAVGTRPDHQEEATPYSAPSGDVSAAVSRQLGRRFSLTADGRYRYRGQAGAAPSVSGVEAGLRVTFGPPVL